MAKRLQELTIIDDFMFGAVMSNKENCRLLLERILDIPIERVEVTNQKSISYHPKYRGIRLDVYAKDEHNTRYNVEMQVTRTPIFKRSRYYHAQIDMDLLLKGIDHDKLPDTYVIFICDYDPFGMQKYRYTIEKNIAECPDLPVNDGVHTIILSNRGQNPKDISPELLSFLNFTKATLEESEERSDDAFITRIQRSIRQIKHDREMENQYMFTEFLIREKQKEAIREAVEEAVTEAVRETSIKTREEERQKMIFSNQKLLFDILSSYGSISDTLRKDIQSINQEETLHNLIREAALCSSIDEFLEKFYQLKPK